MNRITRILAALCALASLAGCASFSPDAGMGEVATLTRERTGHAVALHTTAQAQAAAAARVDQLLAAELTPDAAVELALLNNRGLQARLTGLVAAEADRVRAGRPPNPLLGLGRMRGGGAVEIERALVLDLLGLLTLPAARDAASHRFAQAQVQAALEAVALATQVRRAYYEAVAARELEAYQTQVREAADAANELARRMVAAGNFSRLAQMREQSFYADATAALARARLQAQVTQERLVRLLGLHGPQAVLRLPARLPDLPAQPGGDGAAAERTALAQRLDVLLARRHAEATAAALGLTRATRYVDVLELGLKRHSESGGGRASGWELELSLPLFDSGSARTARAEAEYLQAVHRVADIAVTARSEVRETYLAYRTAYDLARHHRDEAVPLRKRISEEALLRYNGMLISVFELLADARDQVASVTAYVQALRDFWLAGVALDAARIGHSPALSVGAAAVVPASLLSDSPSASAAAAAGDH